MIYRNRWEIEILTHAAIRARQRGILGDVIEATIKGGKLEEFGKNYIKFVKEYKRGKVVCVGEKKGINKIDILTIEWG
jgi:hypothetical protein